MTAEISDKNIYGEILQSCCDNPKTGFYRNGFCQTEKHDHGTHVACATMTDEFLQFSKSRGNDLITPMPDYNFPGLKDGDKWCLCAARWMQAYEAGIAPPIHLHATHEKMLDYIDLEELEKFAHIAQDKNQPEKLPQTKAGAYQFGFTSIDGKDMPLSGFQDKVIMVVNTASQCGFTKQYEDLQTLYETYKDRGFVVIGVPCNNFGRQEPGDAREIKEFVSEQYGITFPMTQKYDIKGENAHPFFEWASSQKAGGFLFSSPKWNFHKFLIGRDGQLIESFGSQVSPTSDKIKIALEKAL